jgi:large subunit ribosomal protein L21
MYAVINIGGKQYKVSEGDVIELEGKKGEIGKEIEFENILLLRGEEKLEIGNSPASMPEAGRPSAIGGRAKVIGEVLEHKKGKKIVVFKYKRRKGYKRKQGHRQQFTKVKIKKIVG